MSYAKGFFVDVNVFILFSYFNMVHHDTRFDKMLNGKQGCEHILQQMLHNLTSP